MTVIVGSSLVSCGEQPFYSESKEINESWISTDSLAFNMPASDTSNIYNMMISFDHTVDYPFQNIYFKLSTTFPSGRYASDIININLADKAGNWFGHCSGGTCTISTPLRDPFSFSESGTYRISIEQYTRSEALSGVRRVGLELWE